MRKEYFTFLFVLLCLTINAQRDVQPTENIVIDGKVKIKTTFSLASIDTFQTVTIDFLFINNHRGEIKDTLKNVKGVPLKSILNSTVFDYNKPKELNGFYFVLTASDGYKAVLSWNEVYHSESGSNLFIVTEINGDKNNNLSDRILLIATNDLKSGRKYIRGLNRIEVKQIE